MNLVIVESPAKAKTIQKYLGKEFEVLASYGHVRDLIPKEGAVDPENKFSMKYQIIERNDKHVKAITTKLKKADALYLATDPDREGEAISWHLYELLEHKNKLKNKIVHRVVFNEITKKAVKDAVANPRELSMDLVNAQQARRALDYLVGFNLSPLLWKKIRRGLSAGRVQSPALRLICERENEIEAFKKKEYWTIKADTEKENHKFSGKLTHIGDKKLGQFSINDKNKADDVEQNILKESDGRLVVDKVEKKQRKRNPAAPFTTSTLQQEASRKLGFTSQRTMRVAQQLYEGVDIGSGSIGLITYMRTDSVHLADEAIQEVRHFIEKKYGNENLPSSIRTFKTKAKNAQEAHEAVRPTSINHIPNEIESYLDKDQLKLYSLIWKRTVACQMIHATIHTIAADLKAGEKNIFRSTGSTIAIPGFMQVYMEGTDDDKNKDDDNEKLLPPLKEGETLNLLKLRPEQHFTEPPPRYSEASLVKALEEHGIGRPSTYASIISTLQDRDYVELEKKRFSPTDVGRVVNKFLTNYFTQYVDYNFTAKLEDDLDAISRGEEDWMPLLQRFWQPFKNKIDHTQENVQRSDVTQEKLDEKCPKCNEQLSIRLGRNGSFIGCTAYPECDYTRNLNETEESANESEKIDRRCPTCDSELVIKQGRYGKFIGCSSYPNCKFIEPLEKPKDMGVTCPKCTKGSILERKSRRGKIFYSCSEYPKCDYAIWNQPVAENCPKCGWPILTIKTTKKRGAEKVCPQQECSFLEPYEDEIKEETEKVSNS
tara:strand:+ start:10415 stop:12727 length:2313 start_codon:yes stop_codon:yes gene_type:complete